MDSKLPVWLGSNQTFNSNTTSSHMYLFRLIVSIEMEISTNFYDYGRATVHITIMILSVMHT